MNVVAQRFPVYKVNKHLLSNNNFKLASFDLDLPVGLRYSLPDTRSPLMVNGKKMKVYDFFALLAKYKYDRLIGIAEVTNQKIVSILWQPIRFINSSNGLKPAMPEFKTHKDLAECIVMGGKRFGFIFDIQGLDSKGRIKLQFQPKSNDFGGIDINYLEAIMKRIDMDLELSKYSQYFNFLPCDFPHVGQLFGGKGNLIDDAQGIINITIKVNYLINKIFAGN